ncbi:MAG TPA: amidase [Alphaproteobacteria bacterium]|nr:amidase [Alphaproteobacteria bacterium]
MLSRSLSAIAAALRNGEITSLELTEAAIARHDAVGGVLNAYKTWNADEARLQARAADAALVSGAVLGPLQGIPISVKDLYGVKGWPTFAGTPKRLPPQWEQEGPVVAALRRQLGVVTGKSHTVELAFGGLGVNPHWGTPRNPWDAKAHRLPGGSSSGAGVSLWEGSALVALGTDTAGSVRIPAAMTGTVGLKTSYGRWSTAGIVPLSYSLDTAGVLARSAADLAYAFAAIDPAWGDAAALDAATAGLDLDAVRIGIAGAPLWDDCSPGIAEAARRALDELAKKDAKLRDAPLPQAKDAIALLHQGSVASAECDAFLEAELPDWRPHLDPIITIRIADGGAIPARDLLLRYRRMQRLSREVVACFEGLDVIAAPTVPVTPPTLEEVADLGAYRRLNMLALRNTCLANYLGLCAITIPVGLDAAGLPVGLQLYARHSQEERLLAIARAAERVLGVPRERLGPPPLAAA